MTIFTSARFRAAQYHKRLPTFIRDYLHSRGIPDETIDRFLLGWTGTRISIPIFGRMGEVLFFRFAKSPEDRTSSPKMLSEVGSRPELYGWDTLLKRPRSVVICEGEFDRLVLEAKGIPAVTSTAGASVFLPEWVPAFSPIAHVYVCFDRDGAGAAGARQVTALLPQAKIVVLPEAVGEKGDVTDFFGRCGFSRVDFEILLANAAARDDDSPEAPQELRGKRRIFARAADLRSTVPLQTVIGTYLPLQPSGPHLVGTCPFHRDKRPSFTVYPATGTYYCFGCGAHGDAIAFLMQKESLTFTEALDELARFRNAA